MTQGLDGIGRISESTPLELLNDADIFEMPVSDQSTKDTCPNSGQFSYERLSITLQAMMESKYTTDTIANFYVSNERLSLS